MDFTELKNFMDDMAQNHSPGNAVEVYLNGNRVFQYACGYSDLETQTPLSGKEMFNIYSCSKMATAVAGVQLLEQGKIKLDDPLYAYIPEFSEMYVKGEDSALIKAEKTITVENLFCMSAGFSYDLQAAGFQRAREQTNGNMDTLETIRCVAKDPLCFEPGSHWQYSISHDVLAALISAVTGMKFRDYMKTHVFGPLDMEETCYHHTDETLKRTATQYTYVERGKENLNAIEGQKLMETGKGLFRISDKTNSQFTLGPEYDSGGAGVITTVSDYAKFMAALANYGTGLNGERILSPESVDLLRRDRLRGQLIRDWYADWPYLSGYGYGLGVSTQKNPSEAIVKSNFGEFGWGGAAGATAFADPKINLGVFYAQHTLNPREGYYQPRLKNAVYDCLH